MWFAAHVYVRFKASTADTNKRVLLEENIILMNVEAQRDVFTRIDELREMYVAANSAYPGYEQSGVLGIRKIISVFNLDGDNVSQPGDKSEVTYELYEFVDDAGVENFIEGKCINARMEEAIAPK